jgi:hypothetical protein
MLRTISNEKRESEQRERERERERINKKQSELERGFGVE